MNLKLKQIEQFLQLAQVQHVSQAAEILNISQPALSKSLSSLEHELGVKLFNRVGNRLQLNDKGQRFYESTREALQILDNAVLTAQRPTYEIAGEISIFCLSFAPILMPCVCEYMELNPRVKFRFYERDRDLAYTPDVNYDFILYFNLPRGMPKYLSDMDMWSVHTLFSEEILFVIGPNHPMYQRLDGSEDTIDLAMFADDNFVTMREDRLFSDETYTICQQVGFYPRSFFQTDSFLAKMDIIRDGQSVSFLPESNLEEAEYLCPGLRAFRMKHGSFQRKVIIMCKKRSFLSEAALDFWDFILDYYRLPKDGPD